MTFFDKICVAIFVCCIVVNDAYVKNTLFGKTRPLKVQESSYRYETYFFKQKVDHFGFTNNDVYNERYLINMTYWTKGGPIFFYTGNEGDITWFCDNTGFIWDIAPQFGAMIVFAEHRYYGVSMPYGKLSFKNSSYTNYLTSEQALADYVELISYLKTSINGAENSRVVAFGGSYGGMLAAWLRMKYPNVVVGSIAASAPIWMFAGMNPCGVFKETITRSFYKASPTCVKNIRMSWSTLKTTAQTESGREFINAAFHLCKPMKTQSDVNSLSDWLDEIYGNLAMADYPYPSNFLEPLPGWPIKVFCQPLSEVTYNGNELLTHLVEAISVYYNYTGKAKCLDVNQAASVSLDAIGWDYQACTEMASPICSNGVTDMYPPTKYNKQAYVNACYKQWGVKPRFDWSQTHYGGRHIKSFSNIVFSNGNLDPWSSLGVNVSYRHQGIISVEIDNGAHHLDLRASNKLDPPSVMAAREVEKNEILRWINE